ncbi:hypothetical protein TCAL_04671 [Tigriopus californicus]|uniref:Anaphase-promoting complex subunit 4 WD40 domain-containing protein n=2 Tax=Tigriopus californicus TaxID=6832 RepID=A0A553NTQ9_TIGCA|nr:hypothetical protein TCAL_04671 [Tigriopus californicus]
MIPTKSTISADNNPPWYLEDDDSMDDDWFYSSIKRYQQISMFHLSCDIQSLDVLARTNLLVLAGKFDLEQIELAVYEIPEKLTALCPLKEGLLHQRDFSFVAGSRTLSQDPVIQVKFVDVPGLLKVILLQKFKISSWERKTETDLLVISQELDLDRTPHFMDVSNKIIVISENSTMTVLNICQLQVLHKITLTNSVNGCSLSSSNLTICLSNGTVVDFNPDTMKKVRSTSVSTSFPKMKCSSMKKSGPYQLAFISEEDNLFFFKEHDPVPEAPFHPHPTGLSNISAIKWNSDGTLIVSSLSQVIIFEVEVSKLTQIFVHDAHKSFIMDCIPHPTVPKLLFSSDSRKRLHAWLYNNENK